MSTLKKKTIYQGIGKSSCGRCIEAQRYCRDFFFIDKQSGNMSDPPASSD